jgi:hypothetical protein
MKIFDQTLNTLHEFPDGISDMAMRHAIGQIRKLAQRTPSSIPTLSGAGAMAMGPQGVQNFYQEGRLRAADAQAAALAQDKLALDQEQLAMQGARYKAQDQQSLAERAATEAWRQNQAGQEERRIKIAEDNANDAKIHFGPNGEVLQAGKDGNVTVLRAGAVTPRFPTTPFMDSDGVTKFYDTAGGLHTIDGKPASIANAENAARRTTETGRHNRVTEGQGNARIQIAKDRMTLSEILAIGGPQITPEYKTFLENSIRERGSAVVEVDGQLVTVLSDDTGAPSDPDAWSRPDVLGTAEDPTRQGQPTVAPGQPQVAPSGVAGYEYLMQGGTDTGLPGPPNPAPPQIAPPPGIQSTGPAPQAQQQRQLTKDDHGAIREEHKTNLSDVKTQAGISDAQYKSKLSALTNRLQALKLMFPGGEENPEYNAAAQAETAAEFPELAKHAPTGKQKEFTPAKDTRKMDQGDTRLRIQVLAAKVNAATATPAESAELDAWLSGNAQSPPPGADAAAPKTKVRFEDL